MDGIGYFAIKFVISVFKTEVGTPVHRSYDVSDDDTSFQQ